MLSFYLYPLSHQAIAQGLRFNPDRFIQFSFNKLDPTWDWKGKIAFAIDQANSLGLHLDNRYIFNLKRSTNRKWLDQNNLTAFVFRKSELDYFGIYVHSWYQVDDQTPLATRSANHVLGLKSIYHPNSDLTITPYLGYQKSENKTYVDWGWDLGINGKLKGFDLGDYRTSLFLNTDFDIFPRRENIANQFNVQIFKRFSNFASDSLNVFYNRSKQQYYSANFNTIIDADLEKKEYPMCSFILYQHIPDSN